MALLVPSKKLILPWGTVGDAYGTVPQRGPEIIVRQKNRSARRRNLISTWRGLHAQLETDTQRQLTRFFRTITRKVLERLDKAGRVVIVDELFSPAEFGDAFNRVMIPQWAQLTMQGARFESAWIGDTKRQRLHEALLGLVYQLNEAELPPSFHVDLSPAMQEHIREFLRSREVGVWTQVGATVHDRLRRALQRALKDGDNPVQMRKRVNEVLTNAEKYQAARIARTETTGAMNHGQQLEREDIGIERKEWVSTLDIKTRGSQPGDAFNHRAADGKTVGNDEQFTVSGQRLAYPGDSSHGASAGNICNCRCAAVSSFEDEPASPTNPMTSPAASNVPPAGGSGGATPAPGGQPRVVVANSSISPASAAFIQLLQDHVNSWPSQILDHIDNHNVVIRGVDNLVDDRPKNPRESYGIYERQTVSVAEKPIYRSNRQLIPHLHFRGTANHEIGHSLDAVTKWSDLDELKKAYKADLAEALKTKSITPQVRKIIDPLLGNVRYKELVANFFEIELPGIDRSWIRPQLVRKLFPESTKVLRRLYQEWLNPPITP